ncbi:DEAD/DEAH box helicase [Bacillus sp. NEB1478]|uniref:DEAD/DEAH box helicase n=1 Tax=Bacillus sp. NEB1478 TaxID=3073816 RepID=UPI002873B7D1|nr:DEAD/DEAH box helicase [Bacillus sp. NEB1478]WNB93504.1 DEAD/DEAH box helicase [Bacillus sp. NEB1478]
MKTPFERLKINESLQDALMKIGFKKPTDIQERVIPGIINGQDMIGQSQTGSGKTFAFLLPLMHRIDNNKDEVQAVITAPTRELAQQIYNEFLKISEQMPEEAQIRAKAIVGGTDRKRMAEKLKSVPQLVIGTPGRINDLVKAQELVVYTANMLVVDEADQMLDMGFIEDVDHIASRMANELQMMVFSATVPEKLQPFLKKYMKNPKHVHVEPQHVTAKDIKHVLLETKHKDKLTMLIKTAKDFNPFFAIIFANTKKTVDEIADAMAGEGLSVERLHGDIPPRTRKNIMKRVQKAEFQFLVATDLAARGIDIKGVSHIINYEFPKDLDFYIHRAGRTGRAGMSGICASLFEPTDQHAVQKLKEKKISFQFEQYKNGEWVAVKQREKTSTKPQDSVYVPKPRKVKPGYKKKIDEQKKKLMKKSRRNQK